MHLRLHRHRSEESPPEPQRLPPAEPIRKPRLVYSAASYCPCGAGLAYDLTGDSGNPRHGYWDCSAILLGTADRSVRHTAQLPFRFYEVMSERSPRARGQSSRP